MSVPPLHLPVALSEQVIDKQQHCRLLTMGKVLGSNSASETAKMRQIVGHCVTLLVLSTKGAILEDHVFLGDTRNNTMVGGGMCQ